MALSIFSAINSNLFFKYLENSLCHFAPIVFFGCFFTFFKVLLQRRFFSFSFSKANISLHDLFGRPAGQRLRQRSQSLNFQNRYIMLFSQFVKLRAYSWVTSFYQWPTHIFHIIIWVSIQGHLSCALPKVFFFFFFFFRGKSNSKFFCLINFFKRS